MVHISCTLLSRFHLWKISLLHWVQVISNNSSWCSRWVVIHTQFMKNISCAANWVIFNILMVHTPWWSPRWRNTPSLNWCVSIPVSLLSTALITYSHIRIVLCYTLLGNALLINLDVESMMNVHLSHRNVSLSSTALFQHLCKCFWNLHWPATG